MKTHILVLALLLVPSVTFAQFGGIDTFFKNIGTFINNILIPLVFAAALLMFIYGMFLYFIYGGDNDGEREKGQNLMIWGVVGFVLMVSIWGIVNLVSGGLLESFGTGISNEGVEIPTGPTIP